jgi:hypothetical protein
MNWEYNSIRIFVSKRSGNAKQIIPTLQPLSGGSVYQFFGWETETNQISGLVVGATDLRALIALKETASYYTLNSPEGAIGSFYLKDIKFNRTNSIYQTMRPDLPCESPVYDIDMELLPSGVIAI